MNYQESLAYISTLEGRGWRLELDRMEHFVDRANLREYVSGAARPQYLHVAGTNGKGSVTAFLQSALVAAGRVTGAFFSPYVVDPRERIQVGLDLVHPEEFAKVATEIRTVAERMEQTEFGGVTEFEFKTAMGFLTWKRAKCDAVALEVGLGGRLDATNVVLPSSTGIVSIGLDHTAILGPDVETIAGEKAGIIKPGIPIVIGEMDLGPRQRIIDRAKMHRALIWEIGKEVTYGDGRVSTPVGTISGVNPRLTGRWQMHNAALAIGMLHAAGITHPSLVEGINQASAPGRFEVRNHRGEIVVLDGAHNGPAAISLVETVIKSFPGTKFTLITNMLTGHHLSDFYEPLREISQRAVVTPIFNTRARTPEESKTEMSQFFDQVSVVSDISEAFQNFAGPFLVTGSNYLVGDAIRYLNAVDGM